MYKDLYATINKELAKAFGVGVVSIMDDELGKYEYQLRFEVEDVLSPEMEKQAKDIVAKYLDTTWYDDERW